MFKVGNGIDPAIIFLHEEDVDSDTVKQVEAISAHPSVKSVRVMPDAHKGNGCCVGFTCKLTQSVLPGLIGGDIGCGIAAHPIPQEIISKKNSLRRLDRIIKSIIPMGNGWDRVHQNPVIDHSQYQGFYEDATKEAILFAEKYSCEFGVDIFSLIPSYSDEWVRELCARVGSDYNYDLKSMCTLGGGNHFVEINQCESNQTAYLTVHTGSRNIGHNIAAYHHSKMLNNRNLASALPSVTKDRDPDLPDDVDTTGIDPTASGLSGVDAAVYFFDMIWAQTWACMNRRAILSSILSEMQVPFNGSSIIESVHNYIDFRDMIIRKGAVRSHAGEFCIVSLNMRDGFLLCRGLGNPEWNQSGPHGCGRTMSRRSASASVSRGRDRDSTNKDISAAMRKFKEEMGDEVYSTCIVPETLDERPSAYRNAAIIRAALEPTATVVAHAKTLLNVKGY